ncbi:MAG: hypothetical protein QOJ64_1888 [Acidobacteriota bacterium]|jgi:F0F1-type ATP synthase membrane subunit c/vacuolar-type H+-ATPase subunit K|nr:hypothetical protein [Acidobacteriota bacterium]
MRLGLDESQGRDIESEVDAAYRPLRLMWLAFLASVVALFFVTRLLQREPSVTNALFWILLAVGLVNIGASFIIKQKLLKEATGTRKPELIRGAFILAFALCESVGLFGLVVYLITGVQYYYFYFVLSGFGILVHKPQREDLLVVMSGKEF